MPAIHDLKTLSNVIPAVISLDGDAEVILSVSIQNVDDTAYVYIGSETVSSTSYGLRLEPGALVSFDNLRKNTFLYAVSSVNSSKVARIILVI